MNIQRILILSQAFWVPLVVLVGIIVYLVFSYLHLSFIATPLIFVVIVIGSYKLLYESFLSLVKKQFALDYIAILAIVVSLITNQYLVGSIIALMIASGRTLEEYGVSQAKKSLTKLIERIPNEVFIWKNDHEQKKEKIAQVKIGEKILVRKGEVIALDGILESQDGLTDESSLTGEPYTIEKIKGDSMRSGTINIGNPIIIRVTKEEKDSTYKKIITMVQHAQGEKAPLVRLADKYSTVFTFLTLGIATFGYFYSHDLTSVLAVLVVATPCPLILATPIALMGGVNASAKKRIIVKKLASLEVLSRITDLIFDKTGTITIGKPTLSMVKIHDKSYSLHKLLSVAEAIERNSLHPLAKAVVEYAKTHKADILHATDIEERVGQGISGIVDGNTFFLTKLPKSTGMQIGLFERKKHLATFTFDDEIKPDSKHIIQHFRKQGLLLHIFTGDKKEAAEKVAAALGNVTIQAECTPSDKQKGIQKLKAQKRITAMVGDGINDAPALALADVGMVFSNEEHTAASEASDIVFLGGDFSLVYDAYSIAKRTILIAKQSILWGIGASTVGMVLAALGLLPPLAGAGLQEVIDVAVIINALRASR